ncbi:UvrD-helicase domain-containing protein [Leptospira idonii]|uniref:RecBCD enzyme subunit RecB n=1 Tax=Leptospira idonii TaxID=1193500 RepID=A0A4V6QMV1_9LEPT|nr:UvrD-helicase domain-containing protein [Leptospira idonii]TGN17178.1 exodeoxyribonuclease V subunit beta [Leptospira idonii]
MQRPFPFKHSFIEASAGTGKTFTIMEIVSDLIQVHKIPVSEILILTFTQKAAGELKDRLRKKLIEENLTKELREIEEVTISTIHGFCNMILSEYPIETESIESCRLTTNTERAKEALYRIQHSLWEGVDFGSKSGFNRDEILENLIIESDFLNKKDQILYAAERLLSEKSYVYEPVSPWTASNFNQNTSILVKTLVQEDFASGKWISYDQMILNVNRSLKKNPSLKESLQSRYRVGILDEFQDTDKAQYEIFSGLFLDANDKALYLIGDPKQSIYSFRGADIGTYFRAKQELTNLGANSFALDTNFRSVPELILGYNEIIETVFPIEEVGENIDYTSVFAPSLDKCKIKKSNTDQAASVQLIQLSEEKLGLGKARDLWITAIADEILQILSKSNLDYEEKTKEGTWIRKNIRAQDIAVLVDKKENGHLVGQALKERGIPFTLYKQQGIYASQESDQILNVLNCLSDPNNPSSYRKLLISDLFQIPPEFLQAFDEHSISSYEKTILDHWKSLARSRRFAELFRSIEEGTRIFLTEEAKDIFWERKRTNYRQIFQKLLVFQVQNHAGLSEVLEELKRLRTEKANEAELPLYEKETEKDAVQILTIHASKGLEWPIVFFFHLKGYMTTYTSYEYRTSDSEDSRTIYRLDLWDKEDKAYKEQLHREDIRVTYVGLTRPKLRLYLPYFPVDSRTNSFYTKFMIPSLNQILESGSKNIEKKEWKPLSNFSSSSLHEPARKAGSFVPLLFSESDLPKTIVLNSYSSIKSKDSSSFTGSGLMEEDKVISKLDDEIRTDPLFEDLLPSSANTGSFLHKLLEEFDFLSFDTKSYQDLGNNEKLISRISHYIDRFGLGADKENYLSRTLEILWNSLHANLTDRDGLSFSLKSLSKADQVCEMDFHLDLSRPPYSVPGPGSFLKGSIDLVFLWKGKYYLADYKSNLLPDYSPSTIRQVIYNRENQYNLQRDIYALILKEYLERIFGAEEAYKKLGGVYYLFLRGMKSGENKGVYFDGNWNRERISLIEKEIGRRILL